MVRLLVSALFLVCVLPGRVNAADLPALAGSTTPPPTSVVVAGHVRLASGRARLERASGRRWTRVRDVVVRRHRFAVTTTQSAGTARYRLTVRGWHSRVITVQLANGSRQARAALAATTACGGATVLKSDGTAWACSFDDEFSGTSLDRTKWLPQTAFTSGQSSAYACYLDSPNNIGVANGSLNLTIRREAKPIACADTSFGATSYYSAGSVMTYHLFSQQYGRFEARVKTTATTAPGLQETFWLWPDDRVASSTLWPGAGEIDVAETYSQYSTLAIPFLHYTANDNGGPVPGTNTSWSCAAQRGAYNTYTLTWSATRIEIDVNGQVCLVNTSGDPAFQKPYILAMSSLLGVGENALTASTPLPATTSVDYIRAWK